MKGTGVPALLLLLLGLTWAEPTSLTKNISLSQAEALEFALNIYNDQPDNNEYAFRVLQVQPLPEWDPTLSEPQLLQFVIKETECKMVEDLTPEHCPFKDNGQVKNCVALIGVGAKGLTVVPTCEPQKSARLVQALRGLKKFFKKLKDK
ncbi:batroxicidin-like, partial [Orycteropus afer afer]|uniref:Batroxicidin-like n=1 Tax=Orycteropus afer afer TaxID=1230840 RepID=A0A8B7APP6_ORYAF